MENKKAGGALPALARLFFLGGGGWRGRWLGEVAVQKEVACDLIETTGDLENWFTSVITYILVS